MLKHLIIKNYALIKELEIKPSASLNVVTGETGAGKSIMLGALGLLMGNRADTKVLWDEKEKCITEGIFDIREHQLHDFFKSEELDYDDNTVIRREISPSGKSRAFINDTPVTLDVMRKLSGLLLDVHSQHETLLLGQQTFQLKVVDAYAENGILFSEYSLKWKKYLSCKKDYELLKAEAETLKAEADYIQFQLDELVKADLDAQEQSKLEAEAKIMEHAEDIKLRLISSLTVLNNGEFATRTSLAEARVLLQQVTTYSPRYEVIFKRIDSLLIELDDVITEIEKEEEAIYFDAERAEFVKDRINTIYRLLNKYRANDVEKLLEIQRELQEKATLTNNLDDALKTKRISFEKATEDLQKCAITLSNSRKKIFPSLSTSLTSLLKELGISEATLSFEYATTDPTNTGIDKIEILFSANKGIAARPLAQVASGGEFARLMFCIKHVMADRQSMPTLVLDEIDTGVSGEIALKLGSMMKNMAKRHQLIAISHLPQIAAKGDAHFFVSKDNSDLKTVSVIKELSKAERIEKIAEMIGGANPSKVAINSAKELLDRN